MQLDKAVTSAGDELGVRMLGAVPGLVRLGVEPEVGGKVDNGAAGVKCPLDERRRGAVRRGAEQHLAGGYYLGVAAEAELRERSGQVRPAGAQLLAGVLP